MMMCIWHPEEKHQPHGLLSSPSQVVPLAQAYVFLVAEFDGAPSSFSGGHPGLDRKVVDTPVPLFTKSHTLLVTSPVRRAGEPQCCRMGGEHKQGIRSTQAIGYTGTTECCSTSQADSLCTAIRSTGMGHLAEMHSQIA